jgi:very-short-patch-repair endonuclease
MPSQRPYFNKSISDLEELVEADRGNPKTLDLVWDELEHRDTDRAERLRRRIAIVRQGLEAGAPVPPAPPSATQAEMPHMSPEPMQSEGDAPAAVPPLNRAQVRDMLRNARLRSEAELQGTTKPLSKLSAPEAPSNAPRPTTEASPSPIVAEVKPTSPVIVSRMTDLIDYVISVEKDKLKIVTDVADHRAFNRSAVQLAKLPGVHFNAIDGDQATWLEVERLAKVAPPIPNDEVLKMWVVLFDDPAKQPRLREALSTSECLQAQIELAPHQSSMPLQDFFDRDVIETAFAAYVAGPWTLWAEQEAPRRETMALYGGLFALQAALGAPDGTPQEFVCGIGYAALSRGGKRLSYPLLTVPLDIELDHKSHVISVVPREEVAPSVETDPLDVLELKQVDAWRKDARRILDALEDSPLSPFEPQTFDAILRQAAALLDPQARYIGDGDGIVPPPEPGPELIVSGAFGFFQRERRATQLMADLLAFRALLEESNASLDVPGAIAALFTEPSSDVADEDFPTFRGINSIPGVTSSDGAGADLFFPKPFNGEQVQIAQRLAVRDGVVVQGPPGTGKTHTIANIISHYLASGKRVLVTSQKTPALQVLQEQLPAPIRPLAVSLLDSDREGLRQFRASVDLIAERLQSLRRSEIDNEIATLESRIDGLHRTLSGLDRQIDEIGRSALESLVLDDQAIAPVDAAKEVLAAGEDAFWLEDAVTADWRHTPKFTNDDIAACRQARAALGELLVYLGQPLPSVGLFSDTEAIIAIHRDLAQAAAIKREISSGELWPLVDETPESLSVAAVLHERLSAWTVQRDALGKEAPSWDHALEALLASPSDPLLRALTGLREDASELADDHAWFMTRPVTFPDGALADTRFMAAVEDLQGGGQGLGALAGLFARRTKLSLAEVRLRGKAPHGSEDWKAVFRHIRSQERAAMFTASWNHACADTDIPSLASTGPAAGREAMRVLDRLEDLIALNTEARALTDALRKLLPHWGEGVERSQDTGPTLHCLKLHLDRARLTKAEASRHKLLAELGVHQTSVHDDARAFVSALGRGGVSDVQCREQAIALARRIEHLHRLQPQFEVVERVSEKVSSSGASRWAAHMRLEPALGEDAWCPSDWRRRWRLRQLASWLDASQCLDAFRMLHEERQKAEGDLSRAYTRLIEQRTWRELKKQASPAVMTALSAYAVAVGRIGKGTGKSANRHRKTARSAANAVKGALPCWIMPHHRVSESLPAELGIFDLVIVDEASQSTLAALPALFRARQILVVGDDKQVSPDHVGLAMDQANARAARYLSSQVPLFQAPMREEASLYDLASVIFGGDNLMLREHFRCAAPIIEFSKRQFYRNELRPLRLSKSSERLDPVLVDVLVTDGYRKGKTNPPEADFIVSELRRMGDDPAFSGRAFGVTTLLGTEQAALIYKRIEAELGIPFIEKYNLRVGDPSAFQGDERDVMFLSMVATAGNATALSGLGFEQRFNVAASRARERMILVRSIELDQLSPRDALRRAILEHFRSPFPADASDMQDARERCESDFEREMFDLLAERGYSVDTQVKVGSHRIDMVVEGDDDRRLAIECDGDRYHGPEQWPADIARQRTLERAGWRIWRCFASRFVRERVAVLDELTDLLSAMDIRPRTSAERSRTYTELREWSSINAGNLFGDDVEADDEAAPALGAEPTTNGPPDAGPVQSVPTVSNGYDHADRMIIGRIGAAEPLTADAAVATRRVTEADVQAAILQLLADGNVWTNAQLKQALSHLLPLSAGDRQRSASRPAEEKWEELVNNALTQSGRSNSLYARGLVSKVGLGRHQLADRDPT